MDAPPYAPRLQTAMDLVLAGAVDDAPFGAVVTSGSHRYKIDDEKGCPCGDAQNRSRWCKHATSVELYRRAKARMQEGTQPREHNAPEQETKAMDTTPEPTPQVPPVTHVEAFAESTLCVKVRIGNAEFSWTLRGTDEDVAKRVQRQLAFLDRLAEERGAGETHDGETPGSGPKPCPDHGMTKMKPSTKVAGQWFCAASLGDDKWCKYKWQAE